MTTATLPLVVEPPPGVLTVSSPTGVHGPFRTFSPATVVAAITHDPRRSAAPGATMSYGVGDIVVYPHHGAAVVERKENRTHKGQTSEYLVLRPTYGSLTVMVPSDACVEVGIRDVISPTEVEEVLEVLRAEEAPDGKTPGSWARRFKANTEKLRSGDIHEVAEVVRNLAVRSQTSELSAGENRLLAKAKQILLSELAAATDTDQDAAEQLIARTLEPQRA